MIKHTQVYIFTKIEVSFEARASVNHLKHFILWYTMYFDLWYIKQFNLMIYTVFKNSTRLVSPPKNIHHKYYHLKLEALEEAIFVVSDKRLNVFSSSLPHRHIIWIDMRKYNICTVCLKCTQVCWHYVHMRIRVCW
jgi:hypothetical protein